MSAAQAWFVAGTVPLIVAGAGHAACALVDLVRPTWFDPGDPAVRRAMDATSFRLRRDFPLGDRGRPSVWRAWLGFNVSHGLGLVAFGVLCLLLALTEPGLLERSGWLRPLALVTAAGYLATALRCWFWAPVLVCGSATACFAVAALL